MICPVHMHFSIVYLYNSVIERVAHGLMQAVISGWRLPPGRVWDNQVLILEKVNDIGWYRIVDVVPASVIQMQCTVLMYMCVSVLTI